MPSGRFIPVIDGKMQGPAQELTAPELVNLTVEEVADLGWYQVIEVDSGSLPSYDSLKEMLNEYNYTFNNGARTATPLYRVDAKYQVSGTGFENSCPDCVAEYINADDKNDNVVKQALAKGRLTTVGTI